MWWPKQVHWLSPHNGHSINAPYLFIFHHQELVEWDHLRIQCASLVSYYHYY
jgi:hypothetical protein